MADHKPFPASAHKLLELRRKGQVSHSADLTSTAAFVGALVGVIVGGHGLLDSMRALWDLAVRTAVHPDGVDAPAAGDWLLLGIEALLYTVGPMLVLSPLCAMLASFLQVGPVFSFQRIRPDLSRMNPAQGVQRMFSLHNLVMLVKLLLKSVLLGLVVFFAIRSALDAALNIGRSHPLKALDVGSLLLLRVFGWAVVVYAAISAADFAFQRFDFLRRNRMSHDEMRREHRETQGDPTTSARRRSARLELVFSRLPDQVRRASAVVFGPGVSVALMWNGPGYLPVVIAKGRGAVAQEINTLAAGYFIACSFDARLAETIESAIPLGGVVGREHFAAVARLLRWAAGEDD